MQLIPESTTLVLAGSWNPAILSPVWLLRNAFGAPENTDEDIQLNFVPGAGAFVRFEIRGIVFAPDRQRLVIRPAAIEPEKFAEVERIASKVLELLPHTPVSGVGFNFEYREDVPTKKQLAVFTGITDLDAFPFAYETSSSSIASSISFEGRTLNLTRVLKDTEFKLELNFHYPTRSARSAAEAIAGGKLMENYEFSRRIIAAMYESEVETEEIR